MRVRGLVLCGLIGVWVVAPDEARAQTEPPTALPAPPVGEPAPTPVPTPSPAPGQPGYPAGAPPTAPPQPAYPPNAQPAYPPPSGYPYPPLYPPPDPPPNRVTRPSAIYGELLGKGLIYSVGFDYALTKHIALGASFSYLDPAVFISPYINVYPVGGWRSSLLLQAGAQLVYSNGKPNDLLKELLWTEEGFDAGGQVSIGYEFRAGFLFRVALLGMFNKTGFLPWPGLTFGGSF